MKAILILVLFFLMMPIAFAEWYVVNIDNEVIAKCDYQPDTADLESRNEIAVFIEEDIALEEAEYRGNKIKKHVKTAKEIKDEEDLKAKRDRNSKISKRMRKIAEDQLIAEGLIQ